MLLLSTCASIMYDSLSEQEHASTLSKEGADITQLLLCRKRQMGLLKGAFSFQTAIVIMKCCFCRFFLVLSRSLYTECSLDRNIVFRYNGIRFTGMIFRFNGMDFGIMPININTHFSYMFVCVGRGERGCGISLHAADVGQTRKTLVNDSFLRSMKVTMKLILRKDLCALRDYSRMGFHRSQNGCLC